MKTITRTITELIAADEEKSSMRSPLPLEVIPNYMGINLVSVSAIAWTQLDDGQLVSLTVHFIPVEKGDPLYRDVETR